jgi:uncharacterized iron-regulated protein
MNINILKKHIAIILLGIWVAGCHTTSTKAQLPLYDLSSNMNLEYSQAVERIKQVPIILVGEHHSNPSHHKVQLAVIQSLQKAGEDVAIGLEMFRKESQPALDRWITGKLTEKEFSAIYLENWNFPWPIYRDIFIFARQHGIAMVGLNVTSGITRQVAYHGYGSLDDDQREAIGNISCDVSQQYKQFIKDAFGAHGHGNFDFTNFCEAQLVWDNVMAHNALEYIKKHPQKRLVILAGTGHARKMGIPAQIEKRSGPPTAVILPETDDSITIETTSYEDADYIFLTP